MLPPICSRISTEVDLVLTLPFPWLSVEARLAEANPYALALQSAPMLRGVGYDSAIIMRPDHWWGALLAKLAGIQTAHRL